MSNRTEKQPERAAIYVRISDDRDGTELGVKRQEQDCRSIAERNRWPIAEVYVDDDRSAWTGKARKEYLRMLDDIRSGRIDAVIAWDHYRLHRRPAELEDFFAVCDRAGLRHMATYSGDIDLSTEDGRFHARIMGAVASKESADKSRRLRRKHLELARNGKPKGGGNRPYGYAKDQRTVIPAEAAIIRELAARLIAGDSLYSMARDLAARNIKSATGKEWTTSAIRQMLHGARISGQREHYGEVVATADWPAIITPEQTIRIRAILDDPQRRTTRAPRRYLLSGLIRCALCDTMMVARPRADGIRRYICRKVPGSKGCGHISILAEPVEQLITEAVLYRLDSPELNDAMQGKGPQHSDAAPAHAELADAQTQLDELAQAYASKAISMREWLTARAPIEARVDQARKHLTRLNGTSAVEGFVGHSKSLRREWSALSLSRQKAIVKAVMDHVRIDRSLTRSSRFDPSRLTPAWRV